MAGAPPQTEPQIDAEAARPVKKTRWERIKSRFTRAKAASEVPTRIPFEEARKLILESRVAAEAFLKMLGTRDLGEFLRGFNDIESVLMGANVSPETITKVTNKTTLTAAETERILAGFVNDEQIQKFLVGKLGHVKPEELTRVVLGLLNRGLVAPSACESSLILSARTEFLTGLILLAPPGKQPQLTRELEAALDSARAGGRVNLSEIVGKYVSAESPEIKRALQSLKRGILAGETTIIDKAITDFVKATKSNRVTLDQEVAELKSLRATHVTATGQIPLKRLEKFTIEVDVVIASITSEFGNPTKREVERYLETNAAQRVLLESIPDVLASIRTAEEAIHVVNERMSSRGVVDRIIRGAKKPFTSGAVFGSNEELRPGFFRNRLPWLVALAATGLLIYGGHAGYRAISPARETIAAQAQAETTRKSEEKIKAEISGSLVYKALNSGNQMYILDPRNKEFAMWVINNPGFIALVTGKQAAFLDAQVKRVKGDMAEDKLFEAFIKNEGARLAGEVPGKQETAEKAKLAKRVAQYEADILIKLAKAAIDEAPTVQKNIFNTPASLPATASQPATSQLNTFISENDYALWYLYNMAAKLALARDPEHVTQLQTALTGQAAVTRFATFQTAFNNMSDAQKLQAQDAITNALADLARMLQGGSLEARPKTEQITIDRIFDLLGVGNPLTGAMPSAGGEASRAGATITGAQTVTDWTKHSLVSGNAAAIRTLRNTYKEEKINEILNAATKEEITTWVTLKSNIIFLNRFNTPEYLKQK